MTEQQLSALKKGVQNLGSGLFYCKVDTRGQFPRHHYVVTAYAKGTPVDAEGVDTTLGTFLITETGGIMPHNRYDNEAKLCQDALAVQDACNLVAVLGAMHDGSLFLMSKGLGTDEIREHPAMTLFADKVNDLCGRPRLEDFGDAMTSCEIRAKGHNDPIHKAEDGKWWFWDETWADRHGPYDDRTTARRECARYAHHLDKGPDVPFQETP